MSVREPRVVRFLHMSVCLRGLIAQTAPHEWSRHAREGLITKPDGSHFASGREALDAHIDAIAKGIEYAPIGKCDNFDVKSGCRGHDVIDPPEDTGAGEGGL